MPDEPTSKQEQSPLSEAQDSVHKARRAVAQALSHTAQQPLEQAQNAIEKARKAVHQMGNPTDTRASQEVRTELSNLEVEWIHAQRNLSH